MKLRYGCLLLLCLPNLVQAQDEFLLKDGQRIVFLGDSNTFAGKFITYLDAYLFTRFPEKKFELINLGLPSETVSGLSEKAHPYPRPNIHDRVDAALEKLKPQIVVICYGMNDGIYFPFSEDRFKKYQQGIESLLARVENAKAVPIVMTPAPFDPLPVKAKLRNSKADDFSWMTPYEKYDQEVLTAYSEWLLSLREKKYLVVDPHTAILDYVQAQRLNNEKFTVSSDGIHPDANGHALIFRELALGLKAPAIVDQARPGAKLFDEKVDELSEKDGVISFKWTTHIPMPSDPAWGKDFARNQRISERLNYHAIRGQFVFGSRYEFRVNDQKIGEIRGEELTSGLDLLQFANLPTNQRAAEVWKLIEERQKILSLAWLTDVGHKRPDTPKGLPIKEAIEKTSQLEAKIRKLCEPMQLKIKFVLIKE